MNTGRTVVFQSFRNVDVPAWLNRCLQTVQFWSRAKGYEYLFVDDRFFDCVPDWYREKVLGQKQLMSDLARLILARELLDKGYERVIWIDADVAVFDPDRFDLPLTSAFCREIWVTRIASLFTYYRRKVNNAVAVFTRDNGFLDEYIEDCQRIVRQKRGTLSPGEVGTVYLTKRYRQNHYPLIRSVGLFSPILLQGIAAGNERLIACYLRRMGSPIYAANLTLSYRNRSFRGVEMQDAMYEEILDELLRTQGELINRHAPRSAD